MRRVLRETVRLVSKTVLLTTMALSQYAEARPLVDTTIPPGFGSSRGDIPTLAPMLAQVIPGVVSISVIDAKDRNATNEQEKSSAGSSNPMDDFSFRPSPPRDPLLKNSSGLGAGVIIDHQQGYIITNHHLISESKEINVTLDDGRNFSANLIGSDQETDIALLQINAPRLTAISMGNSKELRVGDFVIAIGNPFGLGNTATSGIVSALGRSNLGLERFEEFIQTDASINVGNSGGALINLKGELVGINTAILAPNGGSVGIGFAIPVNMVREITTHLAQHGAVERGYLGITTKQLSSNLARTLRIDQGVLVDNVETNSPAEWARVQKGDVLIAINGHDIEDPTQLENILGLFPTGKQLKLSILRSGHPRHLFATLTKPENLQLSGEEINKNMSGVILSTLSPEQKNRYLSGGISVDSVDPKKSGWVLGLRPDDVIFSINRQPVRRLRDAQKAGALSKKMVILRAYRGDKILEMIIK
ncbi:MAG: Do family serine endopeptidase [Gammaproteobacteria bacterium]|nr:Do family serine endopeptidase [Gammaproteobacteria bacterium]